GYAARRAARRSNARPAAGGGPSGTQPDRNRKAQALSDDGSAAADQREARVELRGQTDNAVAARPSRIRASPESRRAGAPLASARRGSQREARAGRVHADALA